MAPAAWRRMARAAAAAIVAAALTAGCTPAGRGGEGGGAGGDGTGAGSTPAPAFTWRAVPDEELPDDVRAWVEPLRDRVGIFQRRFGDAAYVLVSWGERRAEGHAVRIEDVRPCGEDMVLLSALLEEPGPDAAATREVSYPHAVVAIKPARTYRLVPVFHGTLFLRNLAFEVHEPQPYTAVGDRVRVRGRARVFEAVFRARVEDEAGTLAEAVVQAREGAPAWGDFDFELAFRREPEDDEVRLVLFEESAEDGSPIHVLTVPLRVDGRGR